jgi:hypothetical protein
MAYQSPGLFDSGKEVKDKQARTEVLARAFNDAAGDYFKRFKQYEDNIADAEAEVSKAKKVGAAAVIGGLLVAFFGMDNNTALLALGVLVALGGSVFAYIKISNAKERIRKNKDNIETNKPDGEVTFVSQIGVPMYLAPYEDKYMIFDGLDTASQTTVDLANIDGDSLVSEGEQLKNVNDVFNKYLTDESTFPPQIAEQLSPGIEQHRQLERPITDQIDKMTDVVADVDRQTIEVNIHANNAKSQSIKKLCKNDLLRSNGDIPLVETRQSLNECEAIVDEIRGVEQQAVSGDVLDRTTIQRDRVKEITDAHIDRLESNSQTVSGHFDSYEDHTETAVAKHVCEDCLDDRIENIIDELSLVNEILEEGGSLGRALGDQDLNKGVDENFTDRIKTDIQERIPEMDEKLKHAYNNLDDLGPNGGYCDVHEQVDTIEIADSGSVFGEVWRSLYYEFREPIMNSVENMEKDAEEVRQNKEQKMIDLTQYEQIKDNVRREYESVKSEHDAAKTIERKLG